MQKEPNEVKEKKMDEKIQNNVRTDLSALKEAEAIANKEFAAIEAGITPEMQAAAEYYAKFGGQALRDRAKAHPLHPLLLNKEGKGIFYTGDLTGIKAQVGNGKTLAASLFASAILGGADDFRLYPTTQKCKVIYIDTELSDTLTDTFAERVLNRIPTDRQQDFFYVNTQHSELATSQAKKEFVKSFVDYQIKSYPDYNFFVIFDGIVELIDDSNGMVECKQFVQDLCEFAANRPINIFSVIHENQGDNGGKATGNIGSFLYKKVREMYKVSRSGDIFTIENNGNKNGTKYQYGSGVSPIAFTIGEHWSLQPADIPVKESAQDKAAMIWQAIFKDTKEWHRSNLMDKYQQLRGVSQDAAKKAIASAVKNGMLTKNAVTGTYILTDDNKWGK